MRQAIDEVWLHNAEVEVTGSGRTACPTDVVVAAMLEQLLNDG